MVELGLGAAQARRPARRWRRTYTACHAIHPDYPYLRNKPGGGGGRHISTSTRPQAGHFEILSR